MPSLVLVFLLAGATIQGEDNQGLETERNNTLGDALRASTTTLDLRLRFETVDDPVFTEDARAPTLRTALRLRTGPYKGFSLLLEAESVTAIGDDDEYNNLGAGSLFNGVTDRPVIADPELTEINQVAVNYSSGAFEAHLGRREFAVGNQRFVGPVGWRQNHQSFDSGSLDWKANDRLALTYHYIDRVHRIFGDSKDMASHILNADIGLGSGNSLAVYGVFLDYEEAPDVGLSTRTVGARFSGKRGEDWIFDYTAEVAQQDDWADNPSTVDASYRLLELGIGKNALRLGGGLEILGGKRGEGRFTTPLATLHKFNGWADKFLVTPLDGLEDLYISLGGKINAVTWAIIAHDFQSDSRNLDYGSEIDLLATWKISDAWGTGAKAAFYNADSFNRDTDKIMVWTTYHFDT